MEQSKIDRGHMTYSSPGIVQSAASPANAVDEEILNLFHLDAHGTGLRPVPSSENLRSCDVFRNSRYMDICVYV